MIKESDFAYREEPVPRVRDGEFLVRTLYVSFDPALRVTLQGRASAIAHMAPRGRIVLSGMISTYNAQGAPAGPSNLFDLIPRGVRIQGLLVSTYAARFGEATRKLETWLMAGRLKAYEDIQHGFENVVKTFLRLFTGENLGKQLLKIADPPLA